MTLIRFAIIAIALAMGLPGQFVGWLASDTGREPVEAPCCSNAPAEDGSAVLVAGDIADSDDEEWDSDPALVPTILLRIVSARPSDVAPHRDGLMAASGVSGALFRPPRANA